MLCHKEADCAGGEKTMCFVIVNSFFNSNFVKSFIAYLDERCYNKVQPSDWQVFVYPPMVKLIDRWIMARRGS